jgi:hypothetical protein
MVIHMMHVIRVTFHECPKGEKPHRQQLRERPLNHCRVYTGTTTAFAEVHHVLDGRHVWGRRAGGWGSEQRFGRVVWERDRRQAAQQGVRGMGIRVYLESWLSRVFGLPWSMITDATWRHTSPQDSPIRLSTMLRRWVRDMSTRCQ